jgi:hypothetical protein
MEARGCPYLSSSRLLLVPLFLSSLRTLSCHTKRQRHRAGYRWSQVLGSATEVHASATQGFRRQLGVRIPSTSAKVCLSLRLSGLALVLPPLMESEAKLKILLPGRLAGGPAPRQASRPASEGRQPNKKNVY